jgi:hypothetical protein
MIIKNILHILYESIYIYKPKTLTGKTITLYTMPMQIILPYSVERVVDGFDYTLQRRRIF